MSQGPVPGRLRCPPGPWESLTTFMAVGGAGRFALREQTSGNVQQAGNWERWADTTPGPVWVPGCGPLLHEASQEARTRQLQL